MATAEVGKSFRTMAKLRLCSKQNTNTKVKMETTKTPEQRTQERPTNPKKKYVRGSNVFAFFKV